MNPLCDCRTECPQWQAVAKHQETVTWWENACGTGAPEQPGWRDATEALEQARSTWLDHVLVSAPCLKRNRARKPPHRLAEAA